MFGDDVEQDAEAFTLFGEVCAGLRDHQLESRLKRHNVSPVDRREVMALVDGLPQSPNPVELIFIHLSNRSDPARFDPQRVVAVRSYLQAAVMLAHLKRIRAEAVYAVAKSIRRSMRTEQSIAEELQDAKSRLGVPAEVIDQLLS